MQAKFFDFAGRGHVEMYPTLRRSILLNSVAILGLVALSSSPSWAQDRSQVDEAAPSVGLDEIVVTARKRDETLISVPVAVTALSASDLQRYNASDLSKIAQLAPQVMVERAGGGGSGAVLVIRGIGSAFGDAGLSSTVSVNVDGTQLSRGRIITQGFFDIKQVEVLKGPQALFFGKNSPAGVISLRSNGATKDWQGYVRAGYEFEAQERYLEGAISGPISDTLGIRLAAKGSKMRGWVRNDGTAFVVSPDPSFPHPAPANQYNPGSREFLGRLTLDWHPTDEFSAVLKVFGSSYKDNGADFATEVICTDPNGSPSVSIAGVFVADPVGDCRVNGRRSNAAMNPARAAAFTGARDGQEYLDYRSILSSLTLNWSTDDLALTSVTSYYDQLTQFLLHADRTAIGLAPVYNRIGSSDFSQELRLTTKLDGPLNAMIGAFFETEKNPLWSIVSLTSTPPDASGRYEDLDLRYRSSGKTYSVFGQVNYDLLQNLELSVGARYTHESRSFTGGNVYLKAIPFTAGFLPAGSLLTGNTSANNVSPEATLTFRPTNRTTFYVAYKTGFKSGGFSQASLLPRTYTADTLRFAPETVKGFEIGAKGQFFDNRLRLTAAAYRYNFRDLQVSTYDAVSNSFQIRNAASASTTGIELEGAFQASRELQLRAAIAYNVGKFENYPDAPCYSGQATQTVVAGQFAPVGICGVQGTIRRQVLSGHRLARAPELNISGGFSYDTPVSGTTNVGFNGDFRYTSSYSGQDSFNPLADQKGFVLFNAGIRVHDANDSWELALLGKNLTNKYYIVSGVDKPLAPAGQILAGISRPREVSVQGTIRF